MSCRAGAPFCVLHWVFGFRSENKLVLYPVYHTCSSMQLCVRHGCAQRIPFACSFESSRILLTLSHIGLSSLQHAIV